MSPIEIQKGYIPGSLGRVASLHGAYYHEHWDFDLYFEAKVATDLAEFLQRYDESRDGFWTATANGRIEGSISVDAHRAETDGAHLRWFIVSDALRGQGAGTRLFTEALDHCRSCGYERAYLWTFAGLDAAHHLYDKNGFSLAEERSGSQWGTEVRERRFECILSDLPTEK